MSRSLPDVPVVGGSVSKREQWDKKVVELLQQGWQPRDLARKLGGNDSKKTRRLLGRILRAAGSSEQYFQDQSAQASGALVAALPEASDALMRRAARGRVDAVKLAFEVTGFHNPKVKHEHSGKIEINLSMGRPERTVNETGSPALASGDEAVDHDIVDADVVEE